MRAWCARRGAEPGAIVPLEVVRDLGRLWYSGRMDLDWRRPSLDEAVAVFRSLGLEGPFWTP